MVLGMYEGSALTVIISKYNINSKNMYNKFQEKVFFSSFFYMYIFI